MATYITEDCINCGACEPECPWEAIFEDASVPEVFAADTKHNALMVSEMDNFEVPAREDHEQPSPDKVAANKVKWGYTG